MLRRLLTRLYANLLKLYPDLFQDEFGKEMVDVFAQSLSGLDDPDNQPARRWMKMTRLCFREIVTFPHAYLEARRYQASLEAEDATLKRQSFEEDIVETWIGRPASWGAAFVGALPFLLFGLAFLLEGVAELGGYDHPAFTLLDGIYNRPAITVTLPKVVFFVSVLGLTLGVLKGFPRWSYSYLGMSLFFGWSSSNFRYGEDFNLWPLLPTFAAIILGLLLTRSLRPLARLFQGTWYDWTRLSLVIYTFILPMLTVIFFDDDWKSIQLYGLFFDTLLLAAGAVAFLRSRTTWNRVLSLEAVILILVFKGLLSGWLDGQFWPAISFFTIIVGSLLLPAVIGQLRRGVDVLTAR